MHYFLCSFGILDPKTLLISLYIQPRIIVWASTVYTASLNHLFEVRLQAMD